jgi:hypothetical protein
MHARHDPAHIVYEIGEQMKKIEAIIKPFKLDEVKESLHEIGRKGTPNFTEARNMSSTFCPR